MIRLTFFSILGIIIAYSAYWVSANPGDILITWQGWEIRLSVAVSVMLLILYTALLFVVLKILKWLNISALLGSPKRLAAKRAKGQKMLDQAWGAFALDDFDLALKYGLRAKASLEDDHNVLRLLAKATQMKGKETNPYLDALKLSPGNEAWVKRQELTDLIAHKSWQQALSTIHSLLENYPKNAFLLKENVLISARLSDWGQAKEAIAKAEKERNSLPKKDINHFKAVIDYALALEEKAAGRKDKSLSLLKTALKLDPNFAPAALASAKIYIEQADPKSAEKIIKTIWKNAPNRELADMAVELFPEESSSETFRRITKLTDSAPAFTESHHLLAQAAIEASHWPEAKVALDQVINNNHASKETYLLLSTLEQKQKNDGAAVETLKKKAENAKAAATWTCLECASSSYHYSPNCPTCGTFDGVTWG
ncbi:MAG: heme biosynthesis HemY N-terminal domain-containing protein [Emcibacteraceae bacterium]|nr:heme biosynthesis HemY N-terminal domain-containing protein [Emcibacteraceae bacterium]MDG1857725.1 heme biosynthesis HemY N-terminal domain-containing protein [Emcibacteraceae bacterium]